MTTEDAVFTYNVHTAVPGDCDDCIERAEVDTDHTHFGDAEGFR